MEKRQLDIDIVSDIVCPWCIIGYQRLQQALILLEDSVEANITWHPFELAPNLGDEGENLREFLAAKFGSSEDQAEQMRQHITEQGAELGFTFNFKPNSMRYNTFRAHQLLAWAAAGEQQTALKLALFKAYFTDNLNINSIDVLAQLADDVGLDRAQAHEVLEQSRYANDVRAAQQHWHTQGINSVPSQIVQRKYLIQGAQSPESIVKMLEQLMAEQTQ
ncbi:MAG: DsbA family oxidoreductase [Pseudomonadales bacterium]